MIQPLNPADDEPDSMRPGSLTPCPTGIRKKSAGVRAWLVLDSAGQSQVVEAGKHAIMKRTGLPARDLRILDPLLLYPSTVLGRERAIVINLEHIKAIITAQEVLLLNSRDPSVAPFVEDLQRRLVRLHLAAKNQDARVGEENTEWEKLYDISEPQPKDLSATHNYSGLPPRKRVDDGVKVLPFEFIALEACLDAACSSLDNEARTLEKEAHPALDKLTLKISTLNLERVRQIKSRLVAISGRVQKVRDELEHLLDDNEDMAGMYLTEKMVQDLENSSASSTDERVDSDDGIPQSEDAGRMPAEISPEADGGSYDSDLNAGNLDDHSLGAAINKQLDVVELEMLLEAYFVHIDSTLNELTTLREYVEDTEDYINILLDDKQNHLLKMGVMMITAELVLNLFIVVTGILGMNISIPAFNDEENGTKNFLWIVGGGTACSIFLYVASIAWCKHKRLLD